MQRAMHLALALVVSMAKLVTCGVRACPDVCQCIGTVRVSVYCDFKGLKASDVREDMRSDLMRFSLYGADNSVGHSAGDHASVSRVR